MPDIDPARHQLMIHGLVKKPLIFTMEALERYPMTSRISLRGVRRQQRREHDEHPKPPQVTAQAIHGLVSCSEWTGVPLALLLNEAGVETGADWLLAEGADAAAMSRSVPLSKALDDAMLALYQNGERLRPEQGYPMRLLLPGWEGNMNVKWLRRIKVTSGPTHTKDETSKYSDLIPGGKALQFTFEMGVKSVITRPSFGGKLAGPGFHEVSGIAWSGAGRIRRVEVSADGGATLEGRCPAGAGALEEPDALPAALGVERRARSAGEPRDRRERQRAADARGMGRADGAAGPLSQSHDPGLGSGGRREHRQCVHIGAWSRASRRRSLAACATPGEEHARAHDRSRPRPGGDAAGNRGLGHQHPAERRRASRRQRHAEAGRSGVRGAMPGVPRRERRRQAGRRAGRRHRQRGNAEAGHDRRQLLAVRHDALRLHAARDAHDEAACRSPTTRCTP